MATEMPTRRYCSFHTMAAIDTETGLCPVCENDRQGGYLPGSCMLCDDDGNNEDGDPCEVCGVDSPKRKARP